MIAKLKDGDRSVRQEAARALGMIGDKSAIEPLKKVAEMDRNEGVRQAAREALKNIQKK